MLAALGVIVAEASTGVSWYDLVARHGRNFDVHARVVNPYHCRDSRLGAWRASRHNFMKLHRVDAGKVELDGAQYLGLNLPFSISQLLWIEVLLVGGRRSTAIAPPMWRIAFTQVRCLTSPSPSPSPGLEPWEGLAQWGRLEGYPVILSRPSKNLRPHPLDGHLRRRLFRSSRLGIWRGSSAHLQVKEAELKHGRLAMVAFLGMPTHPPRKPVQGSTVCQTRGSEPCSLCCRLWRPGFLPGTTYSPLSVCTAL